MEMKGEWDVSGGGWETVDLGGEATPTDGGGALWGVVGVDQCW